MCQMGDMCEHLNCVMYMCVSLWNGLEKKYFSQRCVGTYEIDNFIYTTRLNINPTMLDL